MGIEHSSNVTPHFRINEALDTGPPRETWHPSDYCDLLGGGFTAKRDTSTGLLTLVVIDVNGVVVVGDHKCA